MQFLWKYVDDMVGKGLDLPVLGKMFFYAALSMIPMALPLSILLASLMTFGNLGEKFELLAMKASGISLLRIMRPIIILIAFVAIGAFFFQNNVLPSVQTKLWTMVRSIKLKSPELDIPEKIYYKEISGYNLYVDHKDKKTGALNNLTIYDFSDGFDNAKVYLADSGRLKSSSDKQYLVFTMYNGESFENLKKQSYINRNEKIPYRRESFGVKEILIPFDANFKMEDESFMQSRDFSKNLNELKAFLDSATVVSDSLDHIMVNKLKSSTYSQALKKNIIKEKETSPQTSDTAIVIDVKDYFDSRHLEEKLSIVNSAKVKVESIKYDNQLNSYTQQDRNKSIVGHKIELHRKFTLSFACLIFLFIGAPLGAIIRKGGLGMPAVISVFLFLFYYSIDIFSVKLARQEVLPVWVGMWLSSLVLFSLGIFFTYKAVNDSVMFSLDAWSGFFKRLVGKKEQRNYQKKEVIMTFPNYVNDLQLISNLSEECHQYKSLLKKTRGYFAFWNTPLTDSLEKLKSNMENIIDDLLNSEENYIIGKLMDYPVIDIKKPKFMKDPKVRTFCIWFFPIGIPLYLYGLYSKKRINRDIETIEKVNNELIVEINRTLNSKDIS